MQFIYWIFPICIGGNIEKTRNSQFIVLVSCSFSKKSITMLERTVILSQISKNNGL